MTQVLRVLRGDQDVTNAVAAHPHLPLLASSGIEDAVKLWQPSAAMDFACDSREQVLPGLYRPAGGYGPSSIAACAQTPGPTTEPLLASSGIEDAVKLRGQVPAAQLSSQLWYALMTLACGLGLSQQLPCNYPLNPFCGWHATPLKDHASQCCLYRLPAALR